MAHHGDRDFSQCTSFQLIQISFNRKINLICDYNSMSWFASVNQRTGSKSIRASRHFCYYAGSRECCPQCRKRLLTYVKCTKKSVISTKHFVQSSKFQLPLCQQERSGDFQDLKMHQQYFVMVKQLLPSIIKQHHLNKNRHGLTCMKSLQ